MIENEEAVKDESVPEEHESYVPRPRWQIVLAWIALVIVVAGVVLYYYQIMHKY